MDDCKDVLSVLVSLTQLIGIPVAIIIYWRNKRQERLDREYGTYHALDDKYIDYLGLCLDNPDLDVADVEMENPPDLGPEAQHREFIIFSILISLLERAFLMYADKGKKIRKQQWTGWEDYAKSWCARPNFRDAWSLLAPDFDTKFREHMDKWMQGARTGGTG